MDFELFLIYIFLVCEKSVLQIFIVLCMNVKSEPVSAVLKFWRGVIQVDFEKNVI